MVQHSEYRTWDAYKIRWWDEGEFVGGMKMYCEVWAETEVGSHSLCVSLSRERRHCRSANLSPPENAEANRMSKSSTRTKQFCTQSEHMLGAIC